MYRHDWTRPVSQPHGRGRVARTAAVAWASRPIIAALRLQATVPASVRPEVRCPAYEMGPRRERKVAPRTCPLRGGALGLEVRGELQHPGRGGRDSLSGGHSCPTNAFRDLVSASVPPLAASTPVRLAATVRGL